MNNKRLATEVAKCGRVDAARCASIPNNALDRAKTLSRKEIQKDKFDLFITCLVTVCLQAGYCFYLAFFASWRETDFSRFFYPMKLRYAMASKIEVHKS